MGNQLLPSCPSSLPLSSPSHPFLSSFSILSHNPSTNILYLSHLPTSHQYVMKQFHTNSPHQLQQLNSLSIFKLSTQSKHLIKLTHKINQTEDTFCSNDIRVGMIFERPYKSLRDEIKDRRGRNVGFNEGELMSIMQCGVMGLKELKRQGHPHQNISSNNIFITRLGQYVLSDPWLNFESPVYPSINHLYLSPQKLSFSNNITLQKIDWYSSDLFSLGMVVLEAVYMEVMSGIYKKKGIDMGMLRQKVRGVGEEIVRVYVEGLLDMKGERRVEMGERIEGWKSWGWREKGMVVDGEKSEGSLKSYKVEDRSFENENNEDEPTLKITKLTSLQHEENTLQMQDTFKTSRTQTNPLKQSPLSSSSKPQPQPQHSHQINNIKPSAFIKCHMRSKQINILISSKNTVGSSIDRVEIVEEDNFGDIEKKSQAMSGEQRGEEEKLINSIRSVKSEGPELVELEEQQVYEEQKLDSSQKLKQSEYHLLTYDYQQYSPTPRTLSKPIQLQKSCTLQFPSQSTKTPPKRTTQKLRKYNSTIMQVSDSQNQSDSQQLPQINQFVFQKYQIGSQYEGFKRNGMRNGRGKLSYHDGGYYDGFWKDDKMEGEGKLYYPSGKIAYEGMWKNDQFHGHGKVYNDQPVVGAKINCEDFNDLEEEWLYYEGNLISDTKQGQGKICFIGGEVFEGEFVNDRMEGRGKFISGDGEMVTGLWKGSKLVLKF